VLRLSVFRPQDHERAKKRCLQSSVRCNLGCKTRTAFCPFLSLSLTLSCSYRYRCVSLRSLGFRILCQRFTKDFFRFLNSAPNCNITKTASCTTSASASCTAIFYGFCSVVWGYLARRPFDAGHLRCGQRLRRESSLHIVYAVDCAVGFWTSLRSLLLTSAEQISG